MPPCEPTCQPTCQSTCQGHQPQCEQDAGTSAGQIQVVGGALPPADRQLFYAASQLAWDPVDPIAYVEELKTAPILLQESVNDTSRLVLTTLGGEPSRHSGQCHLAAPSIGQLRDHLPGLQHQPERRVHEIVLCLFDDAAVVGHQLSPAPA